MATQGRCRSCSIHWSFDRPLPLVDALCPECTRPLKRTSGACDDAGRDAVVERATSLRSRYLRARKEGLFVGVFPAGIVYSDKRTEVGGDYLKLAFLSYRTLELKVYKRNDLLEDVWNHAKTIKARKGEHFRVSTCGQTVLLGEGTD